MKYILKNDVITIDMGEELFLSIGDEKILQLSGTSRTIFQSALKAESIDEIISAIHAEYQLNIDEDELVKDINDCVNTLVQNGMLLLIENE